MKALFYSVGEIAEVLGITERSVYRLKGKIPGYVKIGGRIYYNRQTFLRETQGDSKPAKVMPASVDDRHRLTD